MANRSSGGGVKDVIPESILSISKDGRYIQQCQELLLKFVSFVFERKESLLGTTTIDPGRKLELQEARKHTTWMISFILYVLVSSTTGRTLGMEAVGLYFARNNNIATKPPSPEITGFRQQQKQKQQHRRFLFLCLGLLSAATGSLVLDYFSENSAQGVNNDQDRERSRGRQRRLIHERLRRQMLERAANLEEQSTASGGNNMGHNIQQQTELGRGNTTAPKSTTSLSPSERFLTSFRQITKVIFQVYSNSDGPHNVIQQTNGGEENESRSTSYSIAFWIVRLHMAHFLLTGKYPTLVHRLLGLEPRREESANSSVATTILDRPNTNRTIAVLILLQASASFVKGTSNWCAGKMAKFLEARLSARRRTIDKRKTAQLTKSQLRKKLDGVFGNRATDVAIESKNPGKDKENTSSSTTTTMLCTICRTERKHPAAPSSCGHVLCWNCLIQWVSTVRPECPICRAPCTAKDVLPLYNYDPIL